VRRSPSLSQRFQLPLKLLNGAMNFRKQSRAIAMDRNAENVIFSDCSHFERSRTNSLTFYQLLQSIQYNDAMIIIFIDGQLFICCTMRNLYHLQSYCVIVSLFDESQTKVKVEEK
jgi:hypothetical protein